MSWKGGWGTSMTRPAFAVAIRFCVASGMACGSKTPGQTTSPTPTSHSDADCVVERVRRARERGARSVEVELAHGRLC